MLNKEKDYYFDINTRTVIDTPVNLLDDDSYGRYIKIEYFPGNIYIDTYRLKDGQYIQYSYSPLLTMETNPELFLQMLDSYFYTYGVINKNPVLIKRQMPKDEFIKFILKYTDNKHLDKIQKCQLKDLTLEEILDIMDNNAGGCTHCPLYSVKDFHCHLYCDASAEKKSKFSQALEEYIYLED